MKLLHPLFIANPHCNSAPYYFIHHGHTETAVSAAIEIFKHQRDREQTADDDPLMSELTTTMHDWLVETLLQGAYMREYHLWEKDVKAYLNDQRRWNNGTEINWRKGGTNMVLRTKARLAEFGVVLNDEIMQGIDVMRTKVNRMKHKPGVMEEDFVTTEDYYAAHRAIEEFWSHLSEIEETTMHLPGMKK